MGLAVIMFGSLLAACVVMVTVITYGIEKESQVAPLEAVNDYAAREGGKAQTGLTIVNTCLAGTGAYVTTDNGAGPYTMWVTVRNNGSTVLNPNNSTVLYNSSYYSFSVTTDVGSSVLFGKVWSPLNNVSIKAQNINIYDLNYPYGLMIAASNGVTAISPTAVTNFSGKSINGSYSFNWSVPYSKSGIAYYLVHDLRDKGICPLSTITIFKINGTLTSSDFGDFNFCPQNPCPTAYFYITAVDNLGNMGIPSKILYCSPPTANKDCENKGIP